LENHVSKNLPTRDQDAGQLDGTTGERVVTGEHLLWVDRPSAYRDDVIENGDENVKTVARRTLNRIMLLAGVPEVMHAADVFYDYERIQEMLLDPANASGVTFYWSRTDSHTRIMATSDERECWLTDNPDVVLRITLDKEARDYSDVILLAIDVILGTVRRHEGNRKFRRVTGPFPAA
jgi:hypothetical protein